jgi:hypothetical protein
MDVILGFGLLNTDMLCTLSKSTIITHRQDKEGKGVSGKDKRQQPTFVDLLRMRCRLGWTGKGTYRSLPLFEDPAPHPIRVLAYLVSQDVVRPTITISIEHAHIHCPFPSSNPV